MVVQTTVIWNPRSGRAEASEALRREFEARSDFEVVEAATRDEVIQAARAAIDHGADRIFAAGGDGTISATVDAIMHSDRRVAAGIIPIGTGNDFCQTLMIPLDPAEAAAWLEQAPLQDIDVVEITDEQDEPHFYINMASAGNSDRVIGEITEEQKKWWGPFSYLRGALSIATDLITYAITIEDASGKRESFEIWNLLIANGRTSAGGFPVAPLARPDDGEIDLVIVRSGTLPDLVEASARLLMDSLLESNLIEYRKSARCAIESNPPLRFTADGDLVEWVPVRFEVRPGAVPMLVGPGFGEPQENGRGK